MLKFIDRFRKTVCQTCYVISGLILGFMTALAFVQMMGRYLFQFSILWADEVTVFCITTIVAITVPMLWLDHDNILMDLFGDRLPRKLDFAMALGINIAALAASCVLAWSGFKAVFNHMGYITSYLMYDESIAYLFVVVMSVGLIITISLTMIEMILKRKEEEAK